MPIEFTMMDDSIESEASAPASLDVVLCVDPEVYARLRTILRHLCVGMIDHNVAVRLVTPSPDVGALVLGPIQMLTYDRVPWPARLVAGARRHRLAPLLAKLAERPPSIVHAISRGSYDVGTTIADRFEIDLIAQLTSFADVHGLSAAAASRTGHFIASSYPIRDLLKQRLEVLSDRLDLVLPGVLAGSGPTCFGDPHRTPTILCTTSLRPDSGLNRLLRAAKLLRENQREFLLFLTGSGPLETGLRKLARQFGLDRSVILARPTGNAESIMVGADIYVSPAPQDALGAGPLHAMANGMAVVAVGGGVDDLFVDGVTALVCPEGDPEKLAEAIDRLLADHAFAARLAQGAVDHMKAHHPITAMVERTVGVYRDLMLRRTTLPLTS